MRVVRDWTLGTHTQESAHKVAVSAPLFWLQLCTEAWTIELQRKVVVYRAYRLVVLVKLTLEQPRICWYL